MIFGDRFSNGPRVFPQAIASAVRRYSHVTWALADQAMVSACNFLTMVILARYLGIHDFGRFTLAWMVVLMSVALHTALVISPMVSIGPKQHPDHRPAYFGTLVSLHVLFVVIVFVLILSGAWASDSIFPSWKAGQIAVPLACAAIAYNAQEFLRRYFLSVGRVTHAFTTDAIRYLGQLGAFVALAQFTDLDLRIALWVVFASAATGLATCVRHFERLQWDRDVLRASIVRNWKFSKWLIVSIIINTASGNILFIIAGALLGPSAVGALNATRTLLGVTRIVRFGLDNIVPARAAQRFHEAGVASLTQYLGKVTTLVVILTGGVAFVVVVAPEFWLRVVFGSEYTGFGHLVHWWAVGSLIMALNTPLRAGLLAIERTKAIFVASILSTLFVCASAYGLVTQFQMIGVVAGFLARGLLLNSTLAILFFRRLRHLRDATSKGSVIS